MLRPLAKVGVKQVLFSNSCLFTNKAISLISFNPSLIKTLVVLLKRLLYSSIVNLKISKSSNALLLFIPILLNSFSISSLLIFSI